MLLEFEGLICLRRISEVYHDESQTAGVGVILPFVSSDGSTEQHRCHRRCLGVWQMRCIVLEEESDSV